MARIGYQEPYYINRLRDLDPDADWNHQYHVPPYYIDFYSPVRNIAIEFDENHHKSATQKSKDRSRQAQIESTLECKFYRYQEDCALAFWDFIEGIINRDE